MIDGKKFLGKRFAMVCMSGGILCCIVGFSLALTSLASTYSSTDCVNQGGGCPMGHELFLAKLGNIATGIGLALVLAGIGSLIALSLRQKRQRRQGEDIRH